jgi:hypothetical protein
MSKRQLRRIWDANQSSPIDAAKIRVLDEFIALAFQHFRKQKLTRSTIASFSGGTFQANAESGMNPGCVSANLARHQPLMM